MNKLASVSYAVRLKELNALALSQSGGAFVLFAIEILNEGGVVYGCVYNNEKRAAVFKRAETRSEMEDMRGSKYIQSELGTAYADVAEDLRQGRWVMFSGMPCQVAGLRNFLVGLNIDDSRLLAVDIICHGVPSPRIWRDYVAWTEKRKHARCVMADFRSKKFGWRPTIQSLTLVRADGSQIIVDENIWSHIFYGLNSLRPACYGCRFRNMERPGDVSIGDFWGIEDTIPEMNDDKGVSVVLVNSRQGAEFLQMVKKTGEGEVVATELELSIRQNEPLHISYACPPGRQQFWEKFYKGDFASFACVYADYGWRNNCRRTVARMLPRSVKDAIKNLIKRN